MAAALAASCLAIPCTSARPSKSLVTTTTTTSSRGRSVLPILSSSSSSRKSPLTFSSALSSLTPFPIGGFESAERRRRSGAAVFVCEAAPAKKADSAAKRARQAEKRRVYNKSKKSEIRTRMRKVLEELDGLKKKTDAQSEEILKVEKLIAEAYSAIDKAVKSGTLHRNTGAHRKSRLARRKKAVEIHHGWYTPAAAA
ncbi:30S ribosomal protein S20, chloroplastic [Iris pallida]|uniref:Small ribosomal subunit protein bS20c n=1 Tax=Iris pallida TaxID=29817 RepID=A0AAX6IF11_IRIPA|nr:30S ribosomal protein S20, chloroplastic [Iris pallida]